MLVINLLFHSGIFVLLSSERKINSIYTCTRLMTLCDVLMLAEVYGLIAQLVESMIRDRKIRGSNLLADKNFEHHAYGML